MPSPSITPALADLRAFATVARLRSFSAAARALHLSSPALSRRIAKLEDMLAVRLFDRTTRSVELTALGRRFARQVEATLEHLDRSVLELRDAAQLADGELTIGCVLSAVHHFLPGVIRAFRSQHPNVLVRIVEEGADEVLASVKHGEADFALNYIGMQDPELDFAPLLKEAFVLACPADHPLAGARSVRWEDLGRWDQVRVSHASRNRLFIDQALAELPALPRPVCEVRHVPTLIGLVEAGLGLAVVPQLTVPAPPASVVGVPLAHPEVSRTIGIVRRRGRSLSPAASAFAALLVQASIARPRTRAARATARRGRPRGV